MRRWGARGGGLARGNHRGCGGRCRVARGRSRIGHGPLPRRVREIPEHRAPDRGTGAAGGTGAETAAERREPLALLAVGMIGCDGPTLTVRVFSAVPFERVSTVHADTDSHTSVRLCGVVLETLYGVGARFIGFDARERVAV